MKFDLVVSSANQATLRRHAVSVNDFGGRADQAPEDVAQFRDIELAYRCMLFLNEPGRKSPYPALLGPRCSKC